MDIWNDEYQSSETGSHYKRFFQTVYRPPVYDAMSKRYTTILFRLHTGHCRLNAHLYKLGSHEAGLCDNCGTEETVEHFVLICPKYSHYRNELRQMVSHRRVAMDLSEILKNPDTVTFVIEFVLSTGRVV